MPYKEQPEHFPSMLQVSVGSRHWVPKWNGVRMPIRSPGPPFIQNWGSIIHSSMWVGLERAVLGDCWQGWGSIPCHAPISSCPRTVAPPRVLSAPCIPHQPLIAQHPTARRSWCLTKSIAGLQMDGFGLTGRQLLKRSYVGMAGSELTIIGSSVFIFANICMIHKLLFYCWKKVFNKWRLSLFLDSSPESRIFPF